MDPLRLLTYFAGERDYLNTYAELVLLSILRQCTFTTLVLDLREALKLGGPLFELSL